MDIKIQTLDSVVSALLSLSASETAGEITRSDFINIFNTYYNLRLARNGEPLTILTSLIYIWNNYGSIPLKYVGLLEAIKKRRELGLLLIDKTLKNKIKHYEVNTEVNGLILDELQINYCDERLTI